MNKLSRKDIKLLRTLANTPEKENKLNEYIKAKEKADKLWKEFRESVVNEEKIKPQVKERKFKKGDKVRIVKAKLNDARTSMKVGDVTEILGYKDNSWVKPECRSVVAKDGSGGGEAFFRRTRTGTRRRKDAESAT